jgi:hypothetical protein
MRSAASVIVDEVAKARNDSTIARGGVRSFEGCGISINFMMKHINKHRFSLLRSWLYKRASRSVISERTIMGHRSLMIALASLILSQFGSVAQSTEVWKGWDQRNADCELRLENLVIGETVQRDACDFEMDGPGPWCDGRSVFVNRVQAIGELKTASHQRTFKADDPIARKRENALRFYGTTTDGYLVTFVIEEAVMRMDFGGSRCTLRHIQ